MTISGSLSNALSGLTAAAKAAQTVSSNLSNVMTDGYGRREVSLTSRSESSHGGVRVNGITRHVDPVILGQRRIADSELASAGAQSGFHTRLETLTGIPGDANSLASLYTEFESSLVSASARPESEIRLATVLHNADAVVTKIRDISDGIQDMRMEADRKISTMTDQVNTALEQLEDLNAKIVAAGVRGHDSSALQDERQRIIDGISELVPVREVPRDRGAIALFTTGGAVLLDGRAATVEFTPVNYITPDMGLDTGALSGLTINGIAVDTTSRGPLAGGALAAQFAVRDELAIEAHERLDGVAQDLMERFEDPEADPTRPAGSPGLFADGNDPFDPALVRGLAARLSVNALADPDRGGDLTALRDGLYAAAPGPIGDAAILLGMKSVLEAPRTPSGGGFSATARSANALASDLMSYAGSSRQAADSRQSYASAQHAEMKRLELEGGVDSDQEMQKLLLIEKAYAANARVVQTVEDMLDQLLRL